MKQKPVATRFGEDQLKLASLSSGVEVALVVSASINWGKRCPHFLTETRRAAQNREKKKEKGVVRTSRHSARRAAAVTRPAFGLTNRSILRDRSISRVSRFKFPSTSFPFFAVSRACVMENDSRSARGGERGVRGVANVFIF